MTKADEILENRLRALLEGLQCNKIEEFIGKATVGDCRNLGAAYYQRAMEMIEAEQSSIDWDKLEEKWKEQAASIGMMGFLVSEIFEWFKKQIEDQGK